MFHHVIKIDLNIRQFILNFHGHMIKFVISETIREKEKERFLAFPQSFERVIVILKKYSRRIAQTITEIN